MSDGEYQKRWNAANPERRKAINWRSRLRSRYGMTAEEFEEMRVAQGGRCLICGKVPSASLVVDHDHSTGATRGLLCRLCNLMIGHGQDDPAILRAGAEYLEMSRRGG